MGSSLSVPVIVIFTKFDARYDEAFGDLEKEGVRWEEAVTQAPQRAHTDFEKKFWALCMRKNILRKHMCICKVRSPCSSAYGGNN